ncbi:PREDICTED: F-box protein At1g61340 [Tarenaya hassleriana]|uniref:F-box protein At1g61340 n=1 Tax=Tarenaya hassleriana TaxID=28532 RepID=UPI00053C8C8F|nr:PREDICTED: F-box protein At1g61340 [Tarenaya hassleriana]XP_010547209.1 PREDICTED: F-box protein At1g61340 [Tarenaya hassleriana]
MALGKKRFGSLNSKSKSNSKHRVVEDGDSGLGLGFVQYKRGLGRKRILISAGAEEGSMFDSPIEKTSSKRLCNEALVSDSETCRLQSLPQDILVRVLCHVEHDDLKQLFHVSKTVREATLIAKQSHFAYSTPKKTLVFHGGFNSDEPTDSGDEIEAPGAPRLKRFGRSLITSKEVSGISVSLFT